MNKNDYLIRLETKADYDEVAALVRESFWNVYRPGCLEHYVLHCLRSDPAFIPELAFVMEKDSRINGETSAGTPISCAFAIMADSSACTLSKPASLISPMMGSATVCRIFPPETSV